jgi:CBS domain-containing protein
MLCKDVMRRPVECTNERETAEAAARRMRDANIGFLPVRAENNEVLGVLTDRDLAMRVVAEGLKPSKARVGDIMTRTVIWCRATDELREAQKLMAEHHRSRIIVLDEARGLAGVISLSDITAAPH